MKLPVEIVIKGNDSYESGYSEKVICLVDDKEYYCVYNLNDCPEDAIVPRNLVSAEDYLQILKKGMNLAAQGYDDIEVTESFLTK